MKFSCAIVEDDNISRSIIEGLIEKTGLLSIAGSFSSALEASRWLNEHEIDLLFLDVEMPDLSGLDLFRSLIYKPNIIIISANPEYAVHAFELSCVDYLVKPVKDYARFLAAVNKFVVSKKSNLNGSQPDSNLFVKVDSLLLKLKTDDIFWVEASGDYIKIQTKEKVHTVYSTLKKIEEKLDNKVFVRVHRSYLVNITHITNIDPSNLEINKKIIPISGTYKEELLNRISVL
jgi:DNA-binding LytR/AlgR family response regulator